MKYLSIPFAVVTGVFFILACFSENDSYDGRTEKSETTQDNTQGNSNGNGQNQGSNNNGNSNGAGVNFATVDLTWEPVNDPQVYEYKVLFGKDRENMAVVGTYRDVPEGFDFTKPSASFARKDLELAEGENACFAIVAVNIQGDSQPSAAVCSSD